MEDRFEESTIPFAGLTLFDFINAPGRPSEHRRVDIAKIPLVSGHLAVRMLVPFAHDDVELTFGEMRIDQREGDAVEGEIPRRIPRKFPGIRHRHHALIIKMPPLSVAAAFAFSGRGRLGWVAFEPMVNDVVIKLLV